MSLVLLELLFRNMDVVIVLLSITSQPELAFSDLTFFEVLVGDLSAGMSVFLEKLTLHRYRS